MEAINLKLIQIILRHYFCNVNNFTDEEAASYYFKFKEYVEADCDISWEELGADYIIWQPFETTNPCDVLDNMENLYKDMFETLSLSEANATVSRLDLSAEIANYIVKETVSNAFVEQDNGDIVYSETAQDVFIRHLDPIIYLIDEHSL